MLRLVISDDQGTKTIVPLVRDDISIGRAESNTIRLTERNVSRLHAQLRMEGGTYIVKDLGSYCGTKVNGTPIAVESEVKPGDIIAIGDYVIAMEVEQEAQKPEVEIQVEESPEEIELTGEITAAKRIARTSQMPDRLVILTEPKPGAEFTLPTEGKVRIGRSEELDLTVSHRSVSREHAEIRADKQGFQISDLGSVNGVIVNGERVKERQLRSGDIVELGEVMFRFVADGESYVFDPGEVAKQIQAMGDRTGRRFWVIAGAAAGVTALVVVGLWLSERNTGVEVTTSPVSSLPERGANQANQPAAKSVQDCQSAVAGQRFAEAIAHAAKALEIDPSDPTAKGCKRLAEHSNEQEQIFVRGKAALEKNDLEGAYNEFRHLEDQSAFRLRPEVVRATEELARTRVDLATALLNSDKIRASRLAASVLKMPHASAEMHAAAREIAEKARLETAVASAQAPKAAARSPVTSNAPVTSKQAAAALPVSPSVKPAAPPVAEKAASAGSKTPFQMAGACLARGDNQCIIRALEGKTHSAEELGLLIETYRSMGDMKNALKNMALFVRRYPSAPRAAGYQRILDHSGK